MITTMYMRLYLLVLIAFSVPGFANAQGDIRKVDFKNFTYAPFCAGEEEQSITIANGEYSKETAMDGYTERLFFRIFKVIYGDLDKDGKDEAAVLSVCNGGGTGNFSEGFLYKMKGGRPVVVGRIPGGDRAYGGLRSAKISAGILSVEQNDAGELGASCCPEFAITTTYKLVGGKLTEITRSAPRELYPTRRITFARGMSGKTFTVKIAGQDKKRFTVGARSGQTLSVTVNSPEASLQMLTEAMTTEGENGFTAKLQKNGDYTFEVQNSGDAALSVTVKVQIR